MPHLNDINTRDIRSAVALGCECMSRCFNADDEGIPFFGATARPVAEMRFEPFATEAHVPGRHLNALLNAEDALGLPIDEEAVEKHARATWLSYSGTVALPVNRDKPGGRLVNFMPHNLREGFHALYALAKYRDSARARELAEASIDAVNKLWEPERGWDSYVLERHLGLNVLPERSFVSGIARAIGPLVKYYRATGYGPALALATVLKDKTATEVFLPDGSFDPARFGTHNHSTTCVMSSLAELADLTSDAPLMARVKAFYDNGLWAMRDQIGYSNESADPDRNSGRGEANNSGDILETALILGRWGHAEAYHDAERILRCHILPSQLRDISWIAESDNPDNVDGRRDVARRLRGSWGFPAPYGHEPVGIMQSRSPRIGFNLDIVGGTVASLCEAYREIVRSDAAGHHVNLLFDHRTDSVEVQSPYTHDALRITVKKPGPLWVRVPPWVDRATLRVEGAEAPTVTTGDFLLFPQPPLERPISLAFPLATSGVTLDNVAGPLRALLKGDEIAAMENLGADVTFFEPLP